jgi:hypothetical protein
MADLIDHAVALAVVPHDRPVQLAQLPFDRVARVADQAAHVGGVPIETQTVDLDAHEHVEATAVELKLSHDGAIRVLPGGEGERSKRAIGPHHVARAPGGGRANFRLLHLTAVSRPVGRARGVPAEVRQGRRLLCRLLREAHPEDGWVLRRNRRADVRVRDPATDEEREAVAQTCALRIRLAIPAQRPARQCCRLRIWRLAGSAVPHRPRRARGVPREGRPVRLQARPNSERPSAPSSAKRPERRASQAYAPPLI